MILCVGTNSGKLKVWFKDFWVNGRKWAWSFSSWDPKICFILINLLYLNNEYMNWADIVNADSDAVIFD